MHYIQTQRLKLLPLGHESLLLLARSRKLMEDELGLNPSSMVIDSLYQNEIDDALENFWLPQTASNTEKFEWYTSWEIILKETNTSIGGIGFAGYPDNGIAETGFMLDAIHHGKGFASEALSAMVLWAFQDVDILEVIARTEIANTASRKLLLRCGFRGGIETDGVITFHKRR